MSDEKPACRNDCTALPSFPKALHNRPGLPHIDYRIGSFAEIREALFHKLNANNGLAGWTYRGNENLEAALDDPGIALLEGAAILGDILTFYQELYANEAFLRTARWPESIADLVRLVSYRLSPGLGGRATFAFEVKGEKPLLIPAGFPLKAQLEGLDKPADFETIAEFEAVPALNLFSLYRPVFEPSPKIGSNATRFSLPTSELDHSGVKLKQGDRVLLAASAQNPDMVWQIATVAEVVERFERTEISIEGSWQGGAVGGNVAAYKIKRSFRHFGYNGAAPLEKVGVDGKLFYDDDWCWQYIDLQQDNPKRDESADKNLVLSWALDQEVKDLSPGKMMLISLQLSAHKQAGSGTPYLWPTIIKKASSASQSRGTITGGTTLLELHQHIGLADPPPQPAFTDIRTVEFFEVEGKPVALYSPRQFDPSANGSKLCYYGDAATYQKLNGRSLLLARDDQVEQIAVHTEDIAAGAADSAALRPLILNSPLQVFTLEDFPLDAPTVAIFGNLAEATQGKREKSAILGNGDSRQTFQTFKIPKASLTYFLSAGSAPPETPELQIYIDDLLWTRVSTFFDRRPKEQIYIVREDEAGHSWVQFGDGKTGARLPSGVGNIIAQYRTGTGAYGALKGATAIQPGAKLDRLDKIQLPGVASGGCAPENADNARAAAPGKTQSINRLVSLKDYESEALAISGVSKVFAHWNLVNNAAAIMLTVLMESGREAEFGEVQSILTKYDLCRGPHRFPIVLQQGKFAYVYADILFGLNPIFQEEKVKDDMARALGVNGAEGDGIMGEDGLFGLRQRQFAQSEYASRIAGAVQNVDGVRWVKVTALGSLGEAVHPADLILPAEPKPLCQTLPCDSQHVLRLYAAHLKLRAAAAAALEEC